MVWLVLYGWVGWCCRSFGWSSGSVVSCQVARKRLWFEVAVDELVPTAGVVELMVVL